MVLTNFECWAVDDCKQQNAASAGSRHVDLFNPRAVQAAFGSGPPAGAAAAAVSQISSNGYYGYVNELNNNNNNNNDNNTISRNDVNGLAAPAFAARCKKRFFVNEAHDVVDAGENASTSFAKRCRFDDDFAAQYCNDFFALPSTQIGTQACLMETEECWSSQQQLQTIQQQQQQQQHSQTT